MLAHIGECVVALFIFDVVVVACCSTVCKLVFPIEV